MLTVGAVKGDAPAEREPEAEKTTVAKLLFAFTGLYERWKSEYETRRYQDPRNQDPDYSRRLRELEGEIDEHEPRVRIVNNEGGGGGKEGWQKWILGIVSLSLVGMLSWALGKLDTLNQEVATLQATQTMGFSAIAQRQTADEQRIDRIEARVYRGGP
jgi:hypothetical protein